MAVSCLCGLLLERSKIVFCDVRGDLTSQVVVVVIVCVCVFVWVYQLLCAPVVFVAIVECIWLVLISFEPEAVLAQLWCVETCQHGCALEVQAA